MHTHVRYIQKISTVKLLINKSTTFTLFFMQLPCISHVTKIFVYPVHRMLLPV